MVLDPAAYLSSAILPRMFLDFPLRVNTCSSFVSFSCYCYLFLIVLSNRIDQSKVFHGVQSFFRHRLHAVLGHDFNQMRSISRFWVMKGKLFTREQQIRRRPVMENNKERPHDLEDQGFHNTATNVRRGSFQEKTQALITGHI